MATPSLLERLLPELAFQLVEVADARTIILLASSCRYWRQLVYSGSKDMTEHDCRFARRYRRRYPGVAYGPEAELLYYIRLELRKAELPLNWLLALCAREAIGRRW